MLCLHNRDISRLSVHSPIVPNHDHHHHLPIDTYVIHGSIDLGLMLVESAVYVHVFIIREKEDQLAVH